MVVLTVNSKDMAAGIGVDSAVLSPLIVKDGVVDGELIISVMMESCRLRRLAKAA